MFKGICVGTLLEVFLERTNNRVESKDTPNETQCPKTREKQRHRQVQDGNMWIENEQLTGSGFAHLKGAKPESVRDATKSCGEKRVGRKVLMVAALSHH